MQVLESDRRGLLDDDSLSSEDSDYEMPTARSNLYVSSKWWFQQPAVKKNLCLVIGIWLLILLGIGESLPVIMCTYTASIGGRMRPHVLQFSLIVGVCTLYTSFKFLATPLTTPLVYHV